MASTGETLRLALAGDTMLGRKVARAIDEGRELFAPEVVAAAAEADLFIANLECCISDRGDPWPDPRKPFFFRAPPRAAEILATIGVDCVTLANNHALDFGTDALLDTFEHLRAAGIARVGAGTDVSEARAARVLAAKGVRLAVHRRLRPPRRLRRRLRPPRHRLRRPARRSVRRLARRGDAGRLRGTPTPSSSPPTGART